MSPQFYRLEDGAPVLTVLDAQITLREVVAKEVGFYGHLEVKLPDIAEPFMLKLSSKANDASIIMPAALAVISMIARNSIRGMAASSVIPVPVQRWYWENRHAVDRVRVALEYATDEGLSWQHGLPNLLLHTPGNLLWLVGERGDGYDILLFDGTQWWKDGSQPAKPPARWAYMPSHHLPAPKSVWPFAEQPSSILI